MKITVVGSGYVGLVAAVCFAEIGHQVICVDNDEAKTGMLRRGEVPIHESFLPELLQRHGGKSVRFETSLRDAVGETDAVFIAVGTPQGGDGRADLSYVESVAREIARSINGYKLIVEKSTVPVFTNDWISRIMLLNGASAEWFDVASNPEFLREGTAVTDFLYPDRIVIGADSSRAIVMLEELYRPLSTGEYYKSATISAAPGVSIPPRLIRTSAKSAELIKHASNAFLAMKISFINAVANICESVGADVGQVCEGIGSDSRIGSRFLRPGIGYGGSCFPKDLMAFRAVAREVGYDFRMLDEVININEDQRHRYLRKVRKALWTLRGKRIAVLGLAFKGGTDDIRESPAVGLVEMLAKEGAHVCCYDPAATDRAKDVIQSSCVSYARSAYECAEGADALLVLTDWHEFARLDLPRLHNAMAYPIVVDGRNIWAPETMARHGFRYYSIGRTDVEPQPATAAAVSGK